ncbi:helix-turn-helix transcriptional regulator [[Mycoplasma] falconis]|uniref:Helix-turn-helix transcriptional regulator n=1 Tax=[Mycoplasma] falconis TaxID=92403 RepID=A0A501X9F7_9BACT|nr:helix-turn-helix transcriptional regulator [[Mycoplasma] falconis]TPE57160.1 helix-turn-helix transcriptional regulator [[Mycoplasma] falconis]
MSLKQEEKHICDMKHIITHGESFGDEISYYLDKFNMTQKELAERLNLSIKHINSILNDDVQDVSISIIEALEYAFNLEVGTLTEVFYIYTNRRLIKDKNKTVNLLNNYGLKFLIDNPDLAKMANICISNDTSIDIKLMMLKRFYGVSLLHNYDQYLKNTVLAEPFTYDCCNAKVWIRFCELVAAEYNQNSGEVGIFRNSMFSSVFKKTINIMAGNLPFDQRIIQLKNYLLGKGIILITMPYIEGSNIRAISLKKGARRYIFLSDKWNSECYIFYSLLHEIVHCFNPNMSEEQINNTLLKEYHAWESNTTSKYKAIYDAIKTEENIKIVKQRSPKIDTEYMWICITEQWPHVKFNKWSS